MAGKKPKEIALLEDKLDYIFKNFGSRFNSTGKNFLKKLAEDEKEIDFDNLFFKISSTSVVKSVSFLEEFGTLYDLLIYLLDNSKRLLISTEAQLNFGKAITVLEIIISNPKNDIADQSDGEKKEIIAEQESVLNNGKVLLEKRGKLIEQLAKNNIISKDEKFYDATKKSEESIQRNQSKNLIN